MLGGYVTPGFSAFSITDTFEGFTLNLLSSLMISGPNSPFYKALIEPKIGTDFSSVVGCVHGCRTRWGLF